MPTIGMPFGVDRTAIPLIKINSRAVKRVRAGHPWVYRSDLSSENAIVPRAAMVRVTDERGQLLATALSSSSSQIALRVIAGPEFEGGLPALINERISAAAEFRRRWVKDSDAFRVVFSEADQLPGLVIDRYNDVFTVQALSQAMDSPHVKESVLIALTKEYGEGLNVVERSEPRIRELEELPPMETAQMAGTKARSVFTMNGLRFHFDAYAGQKSGAFLDQRENYQAAAVHARGEALDVFCYQGGFALHLTRVCEQVTGVDASRPALEIAETNISLNQPQMRTKEVEWIEANAFDLLKDYAAGKKQYDTIVLDPPAFAKSKRAAESAARGYKELNLRALKMLRPGGVLITNSCSHHVSDVDFLEMLASAAVDAKRYVRILEKRGPSKDHPVVSTIPETSYLKCVICHVE